MFAKYDLTGKRFGNLIVVRDTGERYQTAGGNGRYILWECLCDCGSRRVCRSRDLKSGDVTRCLNCSKKLKKVVAKREGWVGKTRDRWIRDGLVNKNNTSGVRGVSYDKRKGLWIASLSCEGEVKLRKKFKNKKDAINARKEAEELYFKPILEKNEQFSQ